MKTIFTYCFFLLLSTILTAQSVDKSKFKKYMPDSNGRNFLMRPQKMHQSSNAQLPKIQNNFSKSSSYLEQPEQFQLSEDGGEAVPISLSDSLIAFAYEGGNNTLFFATSTDSGKTWSDPITIVSGDFYVRYLNGLKTNSGRVILIWFQYDYISYNNQLRMAYTDDFTNWYTITIIENIDYYYSLNLSSTNDDKLWLCYSRYNNTYSDLDLYYITSTTNGMVWSNENILLSGTYDEWDATVVSGFSNELLAFYSDYSSGNSDIYKTVSTNGGFTWTAGVPVLNSVFSKFRPKVIVQPDNSLWLFFYLENTTTLLSGYYQYDIQYIVSSDGGITWELPERFTYFSGNDYNQNVALLFGKPFVSFSSSRWSSYQYSSNIWYGLIGKTEDSDPPPAIIKFTHNAVPGELSSIVNAYADDESGISDVKGEVFVNYASQGIVQLYDDGLHNDFEANDNIWGTNIGPFNLGDIIWVIISITDISNNTVNILGDQFTINPVHNVGDLILSLYSNSQLAEMGNSLGTSAYWHGYDYLFLGGLWIGTDISGEKRVMNKDYFEEDWLKTEGSIMTIMPGISDQDCDIFYDDGLIPLSPIGLTVHQKSCQWSTQGHDDFIIFEYIIKNRIYNNIDNIFTSLWLDPDICSQSFASDDLGGYDSDRGMIYMYDPQNNPTGYLGLKLLTETPSTANLYTYSDPQTDEERYQYMTSGIMPNPTIPSDYRTLLTSQPFSLAPGDSHIVAFGLVMGDGLVELKANADTMKALFNLNIVGVNDNKINPLPTKFNLSQNYPNPFNPVTNIKYSVPQLSQVQIKVFDVLGNEIETLINKEIPAGTYELNWNATNLPSGVYFYQIKAGNFIQTKKMILLK